MKLNCAVIDDEFLARQYIIDYINQIPFLNLVGEYNSPLLVLEEIRKNRIDILFLDIQMPDISGLDFLKTLNPQPFIIFTTAHKEYAIDGYEHNVIDYLLKPFSFDRFLKAVNKVADYIHRETLESDPDNFSQTEAPSGSVREKDYLVIRADRKLYKINFDDLYYVEGQKAYVTFHTCDKRITALLTLSKLEESLPRNRFIRIHKSFIVSIKHITSLEGNMVEICKKKLPVGNNYKAKLQQLFNDM